jgi:prolyl-tRNA synthetase
VLVVRAEDGAPEAAATLTAELVGAGVRTELDARVDVGFGRRATDWELKGVPVRVEIGPRDIAAGQATLVRRDAAGKTSVPLRGLAAGVARLLDDIQDELLAAASARQDDGIVDVATPDEAVEATQSGWARLPWSALGAVGEARLREAGVTIRCLVRADGGLPAAEDEPDVLALAARAY